MIIARHHENRLVDFGKIPQPRQRRLAFKHQIHQADEQALLLVSHRNGGSLKVIFQSGCSSPSLAPKNRSVGPARIDDGPGEIVAERRSLTSSLANLTKRDSRVERGVRSVAIEPSDLGHTFLPGV
jgi:hypothetical protein